MDRPIVYPGAIPLDTDVLNTNRNAMIALGYLAQSALGTSVAADGLACTPTSPASMTINVGPGSITLLTVVDQTAYGSLGADTTDPLVKVGINLAATAFTLTAPTTSGQTINYLIEAAFSEVDGSPVTLPYYNATNPSQPYLGPNNSGVAQNTVRTQRVGLQLKAGAAANTGTQVTPPVDSGYVGLYVISVNYGQTSITSSSISIYPGAPFVSPKLPGVPAAIQAQAGNYTVDTSGTANTLTLALTPAPTLAAGLVVRCKVANTNTGATTVTLNGSASYGVTNADGSALTAGQLVANGPAELLFDGSAFRLLSIATSPGSPSPNMTVFGSSGTFTVPANVTQIKVTCVGGGGGAGPSGTSNGQAGSGGGGGGAAVSIISVTPGAAYAVTVGAAGAGASAGTGNGQAGGTSSFSNLVSATGGAGGVAGSSTQTSGGDGGSGVGNITFGGGDGQDGQPGSGGVGGSGGNGGNGIFGGAGRAATSNSAVQNGQAYGAGGGAGYAFASLSGGSGYQGVVIVEW